VAISSEDDNYIGLRIREHYELKKKIGSGKIGTVYKAERSNPQLVVACKVIQSQNLKDGWERELEKVAALDTIESVVHYRDHGSALDKKNRNFVWVLMDYIDGPNLTEYLERNDPPLDMSFIEGFLQTILHVLHACNREDIQHGDLHEGNILISNPDRRIVGEPRRIFVSDFGYGGSHNKVEPRNDFRQLFSIARMMLRRLTPGDLTPRDRIMHEKLRVFLEKEILETDRLQGAFVRNPEILIRELRKLSVEAEGEAALAARTPGPTGAGDYLTAEALGNRKDEWANLFVPEFLAAKDLLSQNNTILTGARGCGKTMTFRRMTLFMDQLIGKSSGVVGAEHFIGFYFNCRDLVETFPWIPKTLNEGVQQQIIHFFHLGWFSEICGGLALCKPKRNESFEWLDGFLRGIAPSRYRQMPYGTDVLVHVRAFIENEKERCRITPMGKFEGFENWPFARLDFLDLIQSELESHLSIFKDMPLFFFLDDFTSPLVVNQVQRVLNQVIFKRRSRIFFKVSTEASNSFERQDLGGKRLELHQDFGLIDLATESLHEKSEARMELLERIFKPRIERDSALHGKDLSLVKLLGHMGMSNNELARRMRDRLARKRVQYHGVEAFEGMWTSDIRIMIQILVEMLRSSTEQFKQTNFLINSEVQNRAFRNAGGEFLEFAVNVEDPGLAETSMPQKSDNYGRHLLDIVQAFLDVSRHELTKGRIIKNQKQSNPRQAFRLEIIDAMDLTPAALRHYKGLVRWHIFMQDWRGKSVRGVLTQRLYLNRVLIPYGQLTFSSKDNIQMTNEEFIRLLTRPRDFAKYWTSSGRDHEGPNLRRWTE
jgi:predicted Ser/Thr protein kinase